MLLRDAIDGSSKTAFPEGKPGAAAEEEDLDSEDPQPPARGTQGIG